MQMRSRRLLRQILAGIIVLCAAGHTLAAQQNTWDGVERVVAVGDVHGDYGQLVKVLRAAKVIDEKNDWIGGKTHLVQTGDVFGRGAKSRQALDLLMSLEPQAEKAGGRVHVLIGNHEAMAVSGDWRYITEEAMKSFGGADALKEALSPTGKYGKWLRTCNAVIKINDTLFVHAGLEEQFAKMPLDKLNDAVREGLGDDSEKSITMQSCGPLWYRGNALMLTDKDLEADLKAALGTHKVNRMVIGHTPTRSRRIEMRAGGRVIMIDVGMSSYYLKGPAACLIIEKDVLSAQHDGKPPEKLVPLSEKEEKEAAGE